MKRKLGPPQRRDQPPDIQANPPANLPAIGAREAAALSLELEAGCPSDEVRQRILQRVLRTVGQHEGPPPET